MNQNNTTDRGRRTNKSEDIFYMNQFYDTNIQSTLTSAEAQIYGAYLRYSNGGKDKAWPSQDKLSANLGLSNKTISRALSTLRDKGYIILIKQGHKETGSSKYVVRTPFELGFKIARDDDGEDEMSVAAAKALAPKAIITPKTVPISTAIIEANVTPTVEATPAEIRKPSFFDAMTTKTPEPIVEIVSHEMLETVREIADNIYTISTEKKYSRVLRKSREEWVEMWARDGARAYDDSLDYLNSLFSVVQQYIPTDKAI